MTVKFEVKGIEEIKVKLAEIDTDAILQEVIHDMAAKMKADLAKPPQRQRPKSPKQTGILLPSVGIIEGEYETR